MSNVFVISDKIEKDKYLVVGINRSNVLEIFWKYIVWVIKNKVYKIVLFVVCKVFMMLIWFYVY